MPSPSSRISAALPCSLRHVWMCVKGVDAMCCCCNEKNFYQQHLDICGHSGKGCVNGLILDSVWTFRMSAVEAWFHDTHLLCCSLLPDTITGVSKKPTYRLDRTLSPPLWGATLEFTGLNVKMQTVELHWPPSSHFAFHNNKQTNTKNPWFGLPAGTLCAPAPRASASRSQCVFFFYAV